jgi:hypothetical protein
VYSCENVVTLMSAPSGSWTYWHWCSSVDAGTVMLMVNTMSCWKVSGGEGAGLDEQAHTATSATETRLRRMDILRVERERFL